MKHCLKDQVIKLLLGSCCSLLLISLVASATIKTSSAKAATTATFTVVAGDGIISDSNSLTSGTTTTTGAANGSTNGTASGNGSTNSTQTNGTAAANGAKTGSQTSGTGTSSITSTTGTTSSQQVVSNGGDLKLTSAPNLTFKKVSAAAVYKGESVLLAKSDNFSQKDTAGSLSVADFRGYQKNYRGWVVSAQATTFTDGKTTISPAITLHFKQTLLNQRIAPVEISSKIAVPVAESSVTPTKGAGIANLVSSISTTLDFKGLSAKELAHFEPGTYHGLIIWSLNNTASAN